MGLPFVPEHDIANAWEEVKARFLLIMIPIADYFEQTWLGNRVIFPIDTWGSSIMLSPISAGRKIKWKDTTAH